MILKDRFDKLLWLLLLVTVCSLAVLLSVNGSHDGADAKNTGLNKAMEREMADQARMALIQKLYGPAEALQREGKLQAALLKLDELSRSYPGEAHGYMLKGEILRQTGALDEAVASYVQGIKLNGDYLTEKSPLSRRPEIQKLVDDGLREIGGRARANPANRSLAESLRNIYYLKSRLAGGCE